MLYNLINYYDVSSVATWPFPQRPPHIIYAKNVQVMRWNRKDILANVDIKIMHQTASLVCSDVSAHSFSSCIRDLYKDGLH